MAKSKMEYDLLISCPGDVIDEIKEVNKAVKRFNELYSDVLGLRVNPKHWSEDSYNQSGGKAQELLNNQFIKQCDAAVAIFWTRFGTPTDKFGSGTEEEIEEMIASGKQVFMYFSEKPVPPEYINDTEIQKQYANITAFRKKYSQDGKGIYATYSSAKDFHNKFFAHLSQHFLSVKRIEELSVVKCSKLSIKAIGEDSLCDNITPIPFHVTGHIRATEMIEEIKGLYSKIASYKLRDYQFSSDPISAAIHKKVEISDEKRQLTTLFAEKIDLSLPVDFFSLGGLQEDVISSAALMGGRSFSGEIEEKQKYNDLISLYKKIHEVLGWMPFEGMFEKLLCIKLAVVNEGNTFDEDIDISLYFPPDAIIIPEKLPIPEEFVLERIIEDYSLNDIFQITRTSVYNDYESSKTAKGSYEPSYTPSLPINLMDSRRNYKEEYRDTLKDIFEYDFFVERDRIILNLHVDYIKHNTAVAFPTVLFVTEKLSDIKYSITAKHNDTVTNGDIRV